ncbi:MAG: response regulator [Microcoleaceae cyanobacterium]
MEKQQQSNTYRGDILVIDDTPANLRLLVNLLSHKGYKVRALPSGRIALAGITAAIPDLILLDIMMPDMDGYEVCKQLKSNEQTREIPIIFISALHEVIDKVKAFSIGGVDYITKPFNAHEVIARVETHLENKLLQERFRVKNIELSHAIEELKIAQEHIIKSEKMAALGQLVASIAHEVNTPLGAIQASSSNSSIAMDEFLSALPKLLQRFAQENQQTLFLEFLKRAIQKTHLISPREKRQFKRNLTQQLQTEGIKEARRIADTLVDINIYDNIEPFLVLLKDPDLDWLLQITYNINRIQVNNQTIMQAVERAAKVVFALKRYARYDQTGEKQFVQVIESLETVLELYHNQLKHGITVIRSHQPVPAIEGYPDELNQVWTNLIHNAIQAMDNQGTLNLSIFKQDNHVVVEVGDTGCGIAPEIQDKIFEPFFTTKPVGEGSGLGLDIVQKIIDKHQGKVKVKSHPKQTVFEVWLPITQE